MKERHEKLYRNALLADKAYQKALVQQFGKRALEMRYRTGSGNYNEATNKAYIRKIKSDRAWHTAERQIFRIRKNPSRSGSEIQSLIFSIPQPANYGGVHPSYGIAEGGNLSKTLSAAKKWLTRHGYDLHKVKVETDMNYKNLHVRLQDPGKFTRIRTKKMKTGLLARIGFF